jgi:hypothetical protein
MVTINFSFDTAYGTFADALVFPNDQTFTNVEIEAMKQQRLSNWIAVVTSPSSEVIDVEVTDVTPSEE